MQSFFALMISLACFGVCNAARADHRDALHFDRSDVAQKDVRCDLSNQVTPEANDFSLAAYLLMSSESGQRLAIITVRNNAGGQRILTSKDIVALLADCRTIYPAEFSQTIDSVGLVSRQISFGHQRYPIIRLFMHR